MALGDFFGINNQDQISFRKLNELIIEARQKKRAEIEAPTFRQREIRNKEREKNKEIFFDRRADRATDKEILIARANFKAEKAADRAAFRDRIEDKIQNAIEQSRTKAHNQEQIIQERKQKQAEQAKKNFGDAFTRGDERREDKQNRVKKAQGRLGEREKLATDFFKRVKIEKKDQITNARERTDEKIEREELRKEAIQENRDLTSKNLQTPEEFKAKIKQKKEDIVSDARERAEIIRDITPPDKHREAVKAEEEQLLERELKIRKGHEEKLDLAFAEAIEILKERAKAFIEIGNELRDRKEGIVNDAKTRIEENFKIIFFRRWRNLFRNLINTPQIRDPEAYDSFVLEKVFKEEKERPGVLDSAEEQFKRNENSLQFLLHENPNQDNIFEEFLEKIIKENQQVEKIKSKEEAEELLKKFEKQDEEEIETEKAEAKKEEEEIPVNPNDEKARKPSPTFSSIQPNQAFKEILTFIDDAEYLEEEKARQIEYELMRNLDREATKQREILEETKEKKEELQKLNREEHYRALEEYYRELIEDRNKTAHEKAVEIGQWINLFF